MSSGALMLDHLGESNSARRLDAAIERIAREGRVLTPDLGGTATTEQVTDAVIAALEHGN